MRKGNVLRSGCVVVCALLAEIATKFCKMVLSKRW
jgi:hypothetical protein